MAEPNFYGFVFFGLIMHIGEDEDGPKTHSALLFDKDHDRCIFFEQESQKLGDDVREIEIVGLPRSPAAPRGKFKDYVPKISRMMGGTLESGAKNASARDAAFFLHAGGTIYAGPPYGWPKKAIVTHHLRRGLDGTKVVREGFVALFTLLFIETDQPLQLKAGAATWDLKPNSFVGVGNLDRDDGKTHDPRTDPHVRKFSRLTNFSNANITMEETDSELPQLHLALRAQPSPWILDFITNGPGVLTSTHSECGNTAWP